MDELDPNVVIEVLRRQLSDAMYANTLLLARLHQLDRGNSLHPETVADTKVG
jgi:hypothetical protein